MTPITTEIAAARRELSLLADELRSMQDLLTSTIGTLTQAGASPTSPLLHGIRTLLEDHLIPAARATRQVAAPDPADLTPLQPRSASEAQSKLAALALDLATLGQSLTRLRSDLLPPGQETDDSGPSLRQCLNFEVKRLQQELLLPAATAAQRLATMTPNDCADIWNSATLDMTERLLEELSKTAAGTAKATELLARIQTRLPDAPTAELAATLADIQMCSTALTQPATLLQDAAFQQCGAADPPRRPEPPAPKDHNLED